MILTSINFLLFVKSPFREFELELLTENSKSVCPNFNVFYVEFAVLFFDTRNFSAVKSFENILKVLCLSLKKCSCSQTHLNPQHGLEMFKFTLKFSPTRTTVGKFN